MRRWNVGAGGHDCFAITVSGEEVAAGKPAPEVYLTATRRLGVDPAEAPAVAPDGRVGLTASNEECVVRPQGNAQILFSRISLILYRILAPGV